jgi:hypothetical protein
MGNSQGKEGERMSTLTVEERKARRLAGMKRANEELTAVQKIYRALVGHRPPVGELKTPTAAVTAARILHKELETRMTGECPSKPKPGDWCVSIGYVSPDLSVLGFTHLFVSGNEAKLMKHLDGQIMLGLIFGMKDKEAKEADKKIVMGTRPFFLTKQSENWLEELAPQVRFEIEI